MSVNTPGSSFVCRGEKKNYWAILCLRPNHSRADLQYNRTLACTILLKYIKPLLLTSSLHARSLVYMVKLSIYAHIPYSTLLFNLSLFQPNINSLFWHFCQVRASKPLDLSTTQLFISNYEILSLWVHLILTALIRHIQYIYTNKEVVRQNTAVKEADNDRSAGHFTKWPEQFWAKCLSKNVIHMLIIM